jgi:hypothetical protein
MRRDRNYERARTQVDERADEAVALVHNAQSAMDDRRPGEAFDYLDKAKGAIEGAMTTAKWATTLPEPEDD